MDEEGKQTMRMLAKNMTFLMKSIELGKKEYVFRNRRSGRRRILFGKFKGVRAFFDNVVHARLDGDTISKMRAGTPEQPRSVNLFGSQIREISGSTQSLSSASRLTAKGADKRGILRRWTRYNFQEGGKSGRKFSDESGSEVPYYKIAHRSALHAARRAIFCNLLKYRYTYT